MMNDQQFCDLLRSIGHGERSFSALRGDAGQRPLAASEQIADRISEEIARGRVEPNAPLREQSIAERFNVSRGPVRAALHLLERDGLVRLHPNRGATVIEYSRSDMHHIDQLAVPISRLHLQLLVSRASEEVMAELKRTEDRVGELLDLPDHVPFVIALEQLTMAMARYGLGRPGEMVFQMLYRPSVRYTIAGLQLDGAVEIAKKRWARHCDALQRREAIEASDASLDMLRALHNSVLPLSTED